MLSIGTIIYFILYGLEKQNNELIVQNYRESNCKFQYSVSMVVTSTLLNC